MDQTPDALVKIAALLGGLQNMALRFGSVVYISCKWLTKKPKQFYASVATEAKALLPQLDAGTVPLETHDAAYSK